MVELTQVEFFSGIATIFAILFTIIVAAFMISKYFRYKERTILLMAIIIILVAEPWWPFAISFIFILTIGEGLPLWSHILIGHILQPFVIFLWMIAMTQFMWKNKQKLILFLTAVGIAIYQTIVLYAIFVEPSRFAEYDGSLHVTFLSWILLVQLISLITVIITGILFFRESRKSKTPEVRLKGTFFLISVLSYATGAILDAVLPLTSISLLIVRVLLASAAFEIYCSFAMPNWIKNFFLREE